MKESKPVKSLVLSGGGVRALAHVGAITRLEQLGMLEDFTHFSGASAGAGVATLLAAGYSCEELFRFMITLDYRSFVDHNPIREGFDLVKKYGLHAPNRLQEAFDNGLEKKVGIDATFASILHRTGNTLNNPATNLSLGKIDVFSPTTSPNMLIRDALRLTTEIFVQIAKFPWALTTHAFFFSIINTKDEVFDSRRISSKGTIKINLYRVSFF